MTQRNNSKSSRGSSLAGDKDQIAKTFMRSFIEVVENFVAEDAHLDVVFKCISSLFDVMNMDTRSLVLKKILMHFLRKFPIEFEDDADKSDEYIRKTLQLWRMFGKCSKTMGPVAILAKIEDTYAGCWQYYQIYAESLIEEGRTDTDELYKTFKNCMEHCELTDDKVREIFGPKIMEFVKFPEIAEEDECTIQFMQIRQNDIRKSLAARRRSSLAPQKLHAILESNDENVPISSYTTLKKPVDDFTVFKDPTVELGSRKGGNVNAIPSSTASIRETPADDFTVFKDPTVTIGTRKSFDANANSPTVCGNHLVPSKGINPYDPLLTSTPDRLRIAPAPLDFNS